LAAPLNVDSVVAATFRIAATMMLVATATELPLNVQNAFALGLPRGLSTIVSSHMLTTLIVCGSLFIFAPELARSILVPRRTWVSIGIRIATVLYVALAQRWLVQAGLGWLSSRSRLGDPSHVTNFYGPIEGVYAGLATMAIAVVAFCCSDLIGQASLPVPREPD
jgi:hypothetical protein